MKTKIMGTIDWVIYIIPMLLVSIGLVLIYSLTYGSGNRDIFTSQIIFASLGIILMFSLSFWDYRNLKGFSWVLYLAIIIFLVVVLSLGKSVYGSRRWIDFGFFNFQPSELARLIMIIVIAKIFSDQKEGISFKTLIKTLILIIIPMILVVRQPDLGTAIAIFIGCLGIFLVAGIAKKYLFSLAAIFIGSIPLAWIFLKDYQKQRIYTFLNPALDPQGSGYNVIQSTITVGSGGLWGEGLGMGTQSRLHFLPVAHTDFIFAVLSEAAGFIGAVVVIALFFFLIIRIIRIASIAKDNFGKFLAIGIASMLIFQVFVHIGMNIGIAPVTGIPLPFVSHGGSALITNLIAVGILQSIHIRHKKISFR